MEIKALIHDSVGRGQAARGIAREAGAEMREIGRVTDIMGEITAAPQETDQGHRPVRLNRRRTTE